MTFTFNSTEDRNNFQKIRVEYAGLSKSITGLLLKASIRTVGGVLSHSDSDLKKLTGIKDKGIISLRKQLDHIATELFGQMNNSKFSKNENLKITARDFEDHNKNLSFDTKDDIVGALANYFGADKSVIISHSRRQDAVQVRDYIAYLLREYAGMSFPIIGQMLGGRDHTTIMHSYGKIRDEVQKNHKLDDIFSGIIEKVSEIKNRKLRLQKELIETAEMFMKGQPLPKEAVVREISPRDLRTLELYREGLTLQNIGEVIGVSRERIRQIVMRVIRQQAINDSITRGIVMDSDLLLEEESKKRKLVKQSKIEKKPKVYHEKGWSKFYIACKSCGTVSIPHVRNGLCEKCIGQYRSTRREEIVLRHGSACDSCGMSRVESMQVYGRDFYITKNQSVYCRRCFLKNSGTQLGGYKNYEWSRFYPACVSCGTTSVPHLKKGLCINCSDFITNKKRELIIKQHGNICDDCGISRTSAKSVYGRDLYITKTGRVVCRKCFQGHARWGFSQKKVGEQTR